MISNKILIMVLSASIIGAFSGCHRTAPWFGRYQPPHVTSTNVRQELPIVIIVPSYNNRCWYRYNLDSIRAQRYTNVRTIYIDDASPDGTGALVERYIKRHHLAHIALIKNAHRCGALANLWHAINECHSHELIVNLDGDDWFASADVLVYFNELYQTHDIWLTYGQFINWPSGELGWCKAIPQKIISHNSFRQYGFWFAQPRTYYAWLAHKINPRDLIDPKTNTFYQVAGDAALMFAMVEMAAKHFLFVPDILCIRNVASPINDFKCRAAEQEATTIAIRQKPAYQPLQKSYIPRPSLRMPQPLLHSTP